MVKLVRKILRNEFGDDITANSKRSGNRSSGKSQHQARRDKREEIQLPAGLLQALKATVDEQELLHNTTTTTTTSGGGGGRRSQPEEGSVKSGSSARATSGTAAVARSTPVDHNKASGTAARRPILVGKVTGADAKYTEMDESTVALIDSIVKGSDDPALLEALQAMMDESDGDAAYHKETLALVAESIVEKQAAQKALERAAHAETRLQESLKKVAPDLVNDTAAYMEEKDGDDADADTASSSSSSSSSSHNSKNPNNSHCCSALDQATASWTTSASTPVHRKIPVLHFPKKNKNATAPKENTTTNPTGDISVNTLLLGDDTLTNQVTSAVEEEEEQRNDLLEAQQHPKKRKNKYKDIVHKKPEIPLYPSYDSRDDHCTFVTETFEDRDTNYSGSYCEGDATLPSIHSGQSSSSDSESDEDEEEDHEQKDDGEDGVEFKIEYTLFELESKLSMSSANLSVSTAGHSSHDQEEDHTTDQEEDDVNEDESDSGIGDESDSDEDENEPFFTSFCQTVQSEGEEDEGEDKSQRKTRRSRRSRSREEKQEAASSILKCVSGYFGRHDEEELEESADDDGDSDGDSTRREKRRSRREGKSRRKEERRSRRTGSGRRHRRYH